MKGRKEALKIAKILPFLLVVVFVVAALFKQTQWSRAATTIYANSSTGNDTTGSGTAGNPYKTFHKAYTVATGGDTIDLTGTFDWSSADEAGDATTTGYTIAKNLTIQGQSATSTIIQAASTPYTAGKKIFTVNAGYSVTFQRLTLRYGYINADNNGGTAVTSTGNLTILSSIITENANPARFGGAAISSGTGTLIVRNSTLHNNGKTENESWGGYTGGIDFSSNQTNSEITNCTFYNNRAIYNGAMYAHAPITVTNSTFINNKGGVSAADIHVWSSGNVYAKNNIFADSGSGSNLATGAGGIFTDGGYNIVETQSSAGFTNGVNGNLVGNQANLNIDTGVADNNTLYGTPTIALLANSVAINAGDPNASTHNGITIPTEDQRGASRPDRTDIGAYEYGGLIDIAEPTTQASSITFASLSYNKVTVGWTVGDGSRHIVFAKNSSSGTATPVDGSTYAANAAFGSGSQIGSSGWYCVYNGTGTSVDVTGLASSNNYIFQVFEYNGTIAGTQNYLTGTATSNPRYQTTDAVSTPATQASEVVFSSVGSTSMTIGWTNGDGAARMVFIKAGSSGTATPANLGSYTANTAFGSGSQIGSSGWYCVYSGTGTSVAVTALSQSTTYRAQVFEYNGDGGDEHFLTSSATNNPKTQATASRPDGENFETNTLTIFDWVTSGNLPWATTSGDKYAGTYSARAGAITHNQSSSLSVTLNVLEAGNISFYKKVSSESCCDYLRFYIDNVQPSSSAWAGSVAWSQSTFAVTQGSHTFKWTYSKDGSVSTGSDTAWVDNIAFPRINLPTYSLEYSAGAGGSISGSEYQSITEGGDGEAVEAIANTGYHFAQWSDGLTDNPRTDTGVVANHSVSAEFAINTYSLRYYAVTPGPGNSTGNGTISGSSTQSVNYGTSGTAVTAIPNTGYRFVDWSDGATSNPRTDSSVTSNVSVVANFTIQTYTLSYATGSHGTISGSTSQTASYGGNGTAVLALAESGYHFTQWSDGSTTNPRTDIGITSNLSCTAWFEIDIASSAADTNTAATTAAKKSSKILADTGQDLVTTAGLTSPENIANAAADLPTYSLTVRVMVNGEPLRNTLVELHSDIKKGKTDNDGYVTFNNIEPGDHKVKVLHNNVVYEQPVILSGATPQVDVSIDVAQVTPSEYVASLRNIGLILLLGLTIIIFIERTRPRRNAKK